jgi:uncharacterized protein DUF6687
VTPLTFAPFGETLDVPNVVVDGSANRSTVLTLSHWPGTDCPTELQADLSAQMAFRYLDEGARRHGEARVVTDNHFDEDGVVAMFALVDPATALAQRELLIDVARAGDFGCFRDRRAARMSMVIAAWAETLDTVSAYRHTLPLLGTLATALEDHRELWVEDDEHLTRSERAIVDGVVRLEDDPTLDLAVVTTPVDHVPHPMAVNNRTTCLRVATVQGRQLQLEYRYETWIRLRSRAPMPRVELGGLAQRLSELEPDGVEWAADPVDALTPRLAPTGDGNSDLDASIFLAEVRTWLAAAKSTWSPYDDPVA